MAAHRCWGAMSFSASIKSIAFIFFTGGRDFFFVTELSLLSFALVRFSQYQNFEVQCTKNGFHFIWLVNHWIIFVKTSNFCMQVERSNFILVPNLALSTNVFLANFKANYAICMAGIWPCQLELWLWLVTLQHFLRSYAKGCECASWWAYMLVDVVLRWLVTSCLKFWNWCVLMS